MSSRLLSKAFRQPRKLLLALATEKMAPLLRLYRTITSNGSVTYPSKWRNLVLLGDDHIGDVLVRTSPLSALATALPDCKLHYLCSAPASEILQGNPHLASVIAIQSPVERRRVHEVATLLRASQADAVFCYNAADYARDIIASTLAGVPNIIGYIHKGLSGLVTHTLPIDFPQPYAAYFRDAVCHLGAECSDLRPEIYLQDHKISHALARFRALFPADRPAIALGLTGRQPQSRRLKLHLAAAAAELQRRHNVSFAIFGSPSEKRELELICTETELRAAHFAGTLALRDVIAFLKNFTCALCVDSGIRHMANAANIPVLFYRNLYAFKTETGTYLPTETDLAPPHLECLSRAILAGNVPLTPRSEIVAALEDAIRLPPRSYIRQAH